MMYYWRIPEISLRSNCYVFDMKFIIPRNNTIVGSLAHYMCFLEIVDIAMSEISLICRYMWNEMIFQWNCNLGYDLKMYMIKQPWRPDNIGMIVNCEIEYSLACPDY